MISTGTGQPAAAPMQSRTSADRAYVTGMEPGTLSVIDTESNMSVGKPIAVGPFPLAVAVAPDGRRAYIVHN